MIYFDSSQSFIDANITSPIYFCIYHHHYVIGFYYGDRHSNVLHNLNGPARVFIKSGILQYYINDTFVGENLSNQQFQSKVKEFVFQK